ncbi:SDR family NAD(P)-dependent oxidoreductase [Hyalangium versicolor]|uniref:SDR family NAD(P)-dependent oxidoreductase n=1 Tax=Hyalangium versicolor TaxID=2861190 RepID=UPI001CCFF357|nr:SDR family NAD(P)-dependent oxidoreductase [Hyalangium versicolor]
MHPPIDAGTILITGAASGVGRELARQLAHRARTLVLVDQEPERLEALRTELQVNNPTLGVVLLTCDVSRPGEVGDMLAELARHFISVDVLVSAASADERGFFARQRWGSIERMLMSNVVAPLMLARRLLGPMMARGRGGLLFVGAGSSQLFLPGAATSAATRRCLDGFIESLRLELEGTGICVTQVAPGPIDDGEPLPGGAPREPRPLFLVSAARCAREALAAFERGAPLVYPGRGHRWVMTLLPRLPRAVRRTLGRRVGRELPGRFETEVPALGEGASVPKEEWPSPA